MTIAFTITLIILAIAIIGSFGAGLLTKNYSHVDRLWSLLPPLYVLIWLTDYAGNPRFVIGAILVIAWGIRLTWNFARRGGYAFNWKKGFTGEDYRWEILRGKIKNKVFFELFNFFFISLFQLTLIFMFTVPLYFAGTSTKPLDRIDIILFITHGLLLVAETVADNEQYAFHSLKKKYPDDKRFALGFNTFGLWKNSRHPNYVCEIAQWIVVWGYAVNALGLLHWSGIGAAILICLFIGSTKMTETITGEKYPAYMEWKKATSPWIPFVDIFFRMKARKRFWNSVIAREKSGEIIDIVSGKFSE